MRAFTRAFDRTLPLLLLGLFAVLLVPLATVAESQTDHEHHQHQQHLGHAQADSRMGSEFRIVKVFEEPESFPAGNLAYDADSQRLWLISFGPPANTRGPSVLHELDPQSGRVLRQAQMPFLGEFGTPAFVDRHLYQIVDHQSQLYKISVAAESFGDIVEVIALPTLNDIEYTGEDPLRFPFIAFRGLTQEPGGQLLAHAQDLGELVTLDRQTGKVLARVPTMRALTGIAAARGPGDELLVIANSDPIKSSFEYHVRRYMFRAEHGMVPPVRYGKRAVHWVLLDGHSGEILASLRRLDPRAEAASVALIGRQDLPGAPYGRFTFFALGEEGVFTLEWTPGMRS